MKDIESISGLFKAQHLILLGIKGFPEVGVLKILMWIMIGKVCCQVLWQLSFNVQL